MNPISWQKEYYRYNPNKYFFFVPIIIVRSIRNKNKLGHNLVLKPTCGYVSVSVTYYSAVKFVIDSHIWKIALQLLQFH